jgi:hypothetical protein
MVWYTTRERVMRAADVQAAAYMAPEIDTAIGSATRAVDALIRRGDETRPGLAPWTGSITFDWPTYAERDNFLVGLGPNSIISITSVVSGGVTITSSAYGHPAQYGAPYDRLAVSRAGAASLEPGDAGGQRSLVVTGVWAGAPIAEDGTATWLLSGSPNATATTLTLNAPLGVGSLVRIDTERVIVTGRYWTNSGQAASLAADRTVQSLAVADGTAFFAGEELLLDAERVLVRDITGNTLIVQRAVGGSALAVHTTATVYYSRSFEVERGALGTTAAAHTSGARLYAWRPPALAEQLTVAYALDQRAQESAAYARTIGSGEGVRNASGAGIKSLEERVLAAYGRVLYGAA